jgi:hypothetical protein
MADFSNIKVGDEVAVKPQFGNLYIGKVVSVTPKRFTVGSWTFRKDNGCLVGGGMWDTTRVFYPTANDYDTVKRSNYMIAAENYAKKLLEQMRDGRFATDEMGLIAATLRGKCKPDA